MLSRDSSMRSTASSYSPDPVDPLTVEYTDNPTQQAEVKDMDSLMAEIASTREEETERKIIDSVEVIFLHFNRLPSAYITSHDILKKNMILSATPG